MAPKKEPEKEVRDADEVIRSYYEGTTEGAFRDDATEPVSSMRRERQDDEAHSTELSGGDVDAAADGNVGLETVSGSNPTPDQDIVEDLGRAVGVTYQDNEPLKFDDKIAARDEQRWELDPASSEDYQERTAEGEGSPSPPGAASSEPIESQAKPKSNKRSSGRSAARGRPPS